VLRLMVSLFFVALLLWSCGPDSRNCSGPNFRVVLKLAAGPLPADTVVHVTYGGSAVENFRLSDESAPHNKVAFCQVADEYGTPLAPSAPSAPEGTDAAGAAGVAGAAGAGPDSGDPAPDVAAIYCELWTGGFTELEITGTGFETRDYDLAPKKGVCTVNEAPFVLDSPDAG
jgi:hypothetical protein